MAPDAPPPASRRSPPDSSASSPDGEGGPNLVAEFQAPAGAFPRPPLVARKVDREILAHADVVAFQIPLVAPPPIAIPTGEPSDPVDDPLPRKAGEPSMGNPPHLARRSGAAGHEGELTVGHDLPARHALEHFVHAHSEGRGLAWRMRLHGSPIFAASLRLPRVPRILRIPLTSGFGGACLGYKMC